MERIQDGRRNIVIHGDASVDDLPVTGLDELPPVANGDSFVPVNMDEPTLYAGDVLVGVKDGEIEFVELIYDVVDGGVLVLPLDTGIYTLHDEQQFSARFYRYDEMHIFDDVTREVPDPDVEFDASKLPQPETSRAR